MTLRTSLRIWRSRLTPWRTAVRIARRDAMRAKGRSILVLLMIALPIAGVGAVDISFRSSQGSPEQQLVRELGAADARYSPAGFGGLPVEQNPVPPYGYGVPPEHEDDTRYGAKLPPADVRAVLPRGATYLIDTEDNVLVRTRHGFLDTEIRELRAEHPMAAGITNLVRGRYPTGPGEIAATQSFLERSGLNLGSGTRVRGLDRRLTIVGVVEFPESLDFPTLQAPPGTVLEPLARMTGQYSGGFSGARSSYLVSLPGPVTWEMALRANERGVVVKSRHVTLHPPSPDQVLYREDGSPGLDANVLELISVVTVVGMAVLEICLLAGPAFAVGARRSRRQLGLLGANGADRPQVGAVVLAGGLVLGTAAAVLGLLLAVGLTVAFRPLLEQGVGQRFYGFEIRPLELGAIAFTGVVTGVLSAMVPAFTASQQSVLAALTGRRRAGAAVGMPVFGMGATFLGVSIAVFGAASGQGAYSVLIGSVIAEVGVVAMTPALVDVCGKASRWLPLAPRLALRDAVRNRSRTAPAVAAVLAAVAGTVAVATYAASSDQQGLRTYEASLPGERVAVVIPPGDVARTDLIRQVVEDDLRERERADIARIVPGSKDCGPYGSGDDRDCGTAVLAVPEANRCPLDAVEEPTDAQERKHGSDWRCRTGIEFGALPFDSDNGVLVGGVEVLRALDIDEPEAARALERGEAVVFDRARVLDGKAQLVVAALADPEAEPAGDPPEGVRRLSLDAHLSDANSFEVNALVPPKALAGKGVRTVPFGSIYTVPENPSSKAEQQLEARLYRLGADADLYIERGYHAGTSITLVILAAFGGLITLGAAGIATGLAQADAEADLATLAAVGAAPRMRRILAGLQCGVIAAMGAVLGSVAGLVPAIGLLKAEERVDRARYLEEVAHGQEGLPWERPIVVPWLTLLLIVVVVPLIAAALAGLFTRSRIVLTRRTG